MKTEGMTEEEINARHAEKMAKKKAARDRMIATKTLEKGLLIVHTGKGKGKSTAALGMVMRGIGHGFKQLVALIVGGVVLLVGVVMLLKGISNMKKLNLTPERTLETLKSDASLVRGRTP